MKKANDTFSETYYKQKSEERWLEGGNKGGKKIDGRNEHAGREDMKSIIHNQNFNETNKHVVRSNGLKPGETEVGVAVHRKSMQHKKTEPGTDKNFDQAVSHIRQNSDARNLAKIFAARDISSMNFIATYHENFSENKINNITSS